MAPDVVNTVARERVPGLQLASMSFDDLISDLDMSKRQAERFFLYSGAPPPPIVPPTPERVGSTQVSASSVFEDNQPESVSENKLQEDVAKFNAALQNGWEVKKAPLDRNSSLQGEGHATEASWGVGDGVVTKEKVTRAELEAMSCTQACSWLRLLGTHSETVFAL